MHFDRRPGFKGGQTHAPAALVTGTIIQYSRNRWTEDPRSVTSNFTGRSHLRPILHVFWRTKYPPQQLKHLLKCVWLRSLASANGRNCENESVKIVESVTNGGPQRILPAERGVRAPRKLCDNDDDIIACHLLTNQSLRKIYIITMEYSSVM
jgi:hypothetical protein